MNRRQIGATVIMVGGVVMLLGGVFTLVDSTASTDAAATSILTTTPPAPEAADTTTSSTTTTSTTTTSTTTTTTSATTSTTIPIETAEEFLAKLVEGLRGDPDLLVSLLNQATIDIYGAEQCLATFQTVLDPETELTIREVGEIGSWDYVIDGITSPLVNVIGVEVDRVVNGQTLIQELHWQLVDGRWTWFSDCGEPLLS